MPHVSTGSSRLQVCMELLCFFPQVQFWGVATCPMVICSCAYFVVCSSYVLQQELATTSEVQQDAMIQYCCVESACCVTA
jgi:hypothetical protein